MRLCQKELNSLSSDISKSIHEFESQHGNIIKKLELVRAENGNFLFIELIPYLPGENP